MKISHTFKSVAARSLRDAALRLDSIRPPEPGIVVLAYHRVGAGTDSAVDTSTDDFRRQMDCLAEGHRVLSLDAAADELDAGLAKPGVVLTFDDGTDDFVENALPVLVEHGFPAAVYLSTHYADENEAFPWGAEPMVWSAAREAAATGLVTIEAHTHSHAVMTSMEPDAAEHDLNRCDDLIELEVGRRPRHFAYPKGRIAHPPVEALVRTRYRTSAGARIGVNTPATDPHQLRRSPIKRSDDLTVFAAKASGGMQLEGTVRESYNAVRYRRVTT